MRLNLFILFFSLQPLWLFSAVRSESGKIDFKLGADEEASVSLQNSGLSVGSNLSASANLHVFGNAIITNGLNLSGPLDQTPSIVSSNTTLANQLMVMANTVENDITLTLPSANNLTGRVYHIKKNSYKNNLIITSSSKIDELHSSIFMSESNYFAAVLPSVKLVSSANTWWVIESNSLNNFWTPNQLTTFGWYDASKDDSLSYDSHGNVTQWNDLSGNDQHLTESNDGRHPKTGVREINGLNVLDFDGDDRISDTTFSTSDSGNIACFIVGIPDVVDHANDGFVAFDNNSSRDWQLDADVVGTYEARVNVDGIDGDLNHNADYLGMTNMYSVIFDAANTQIELFVDGDSVGTKNYSSTTLLNPVECRVMSNRGNSNFLDGAFAEMVVTESVDATTRERVEGYLAWKWGLQSQLPSSHPYKTVAPAQ